MIALNKQPEQDPNAKAINIAFGASLLCSPLVLGIGLLIADPVWSLGLCLVAAWVVFILTLIAALHYQK